MRACWFIAIGLCCLGGFALQCDGCCLSASCLEFDRAPAADTESPADRSGVLALELTASGDALRTSCPTASLLLPRIGRAVQSTVASSHRRAVRTDDAVAAPGRDTVTDELVPFVEATLQPRSIRLQI